MSNKGWIVEKGKHNGLPIFPSDQILDSITYDDVITALQCDTQQTVEEVIYNILQSSIHDLEYCIKEYSNRIYELADINLEDVKRKDRLNINIRIDKKLIV